MLYFAIAVFVITYILMISLPNYRHWVALISAAIFIVSGILPASDIIGKINWNVLFMLFGTMGTVYFFIESKMPDVLAEKLLSTAPNTMWVVVMLSLFSGIISAFMDNVATVLMLAPIGLAVAKQLKISPVEMLICISVSSNLQGAATLVGDTTSIMLGGYADMNFIDFIFMNGKFSIFWAVELGALATVPVIMILFRKEKHNVSIVPKHKVEDPVPTCLLILNILLLIAASFFQEKLPGTINGLICIAVFLAAAIHSVIKNRGKFDKVLTALKDIDFNTLLLLFSLFIIIAGVESAGLLEILAQFIVKLGGGNIFIVYTIIVFVSVILSAFIDNIPYVATMLPVISQLALKLNYPGIPYVLFFGLLTGATLGGNITPIGASANIAAIGILRKNGYTVKNRQFLRIGMPFTAVAVLAGYIFIWFVWK